MRLSGREHRSGNVGGMKLGKFIDLQVIETRLRTMEEQLGVGEYVGSYDDSYADIMSDDYMLGIRHAVRFLRTGKRPDSRELPGYDSTR